MFLESHLIAFMCVTEQKVSVTSLIPLRSISVTEIYYLGIMVWGLVNMIQGQSVFFVISRNGVEKLA